MQETELKCWRLLPVFDEQDAMKLRKHKYSGSDEGLMYKWFYSPIANKLVECLPDTVAPNTLTLIGFIHSLTPVILCFSIGGLNLVGKVPSWILFLNAYCYFAYRMLDEMDGKQARRTGNSSPLGLLFDHGCDCFSTGLQAILTLRVVQIGNNWISFVCIVIGICTFHFTTLEEYYIGTLKLPVGNAVSDGSVLVVLVFIVTGITGNEVWVHEVVSAEWLGIEGVTMLTIGQLIFGIFIFVILITLLVNFWTILRSGCKPWET